MYSGYMLSQAGFLLFNVSAWNMAIYTVAWLRADEEGPRLP